MLKYKQQSRTKESASSLSDHIFLNIRDDIVANKLMQGQKLTEEGICKEYEVSRTPVREAFKQLESEGLIEMIPNRGAFVVGISESEIEDMYCLRKEYEILAVRWAIARISKSELEDLKEAYEFMEFYTKKRDYDKMLNINTNFHRIIYMAARNKILQRILTEFQTYMKPYRTDSSCSDKDMDRILAEHRDIYQAFLLKDEEKGAHAMAVHLDNAQKRKNI